MTGKRVAVSTQEQNPRSAVARTVLVAVVALFPLLNGALVILIAELQPYQVHLPVWLFPALNGVLVATAVLMGIGTKIMALPGVNIWLRKYLPMFAPEDKAKGNTAGPDLTDEYHEATRNNTTS